MTALQTRSPAENLILLAIDPTRGKNRLSNETALGGAFLVDLVAAGRVSIESAPVMGLTRRKITVIDDSSVTDPALDAAFARIRHKRAQSPTSAVTILARKAWLRSSEAMEKSGQLRRRYPNTFGFVLVRYDVANPARRAALVESVRAVLLSGQPADASTGPLVGLLHAANLLHLVVSRSERRAAKIRQGDLGQRLARRGSPQRHRRRSGCHRGRRSRRRLLRPVS